mmetsp:Transcript_24928/g.72095  ORF Transcript_24928/g.72095 Transcript_24928/m.72095 type:complete len:238 (+) Transcript_24928:60-773(+)
MTAAVAPSSNIQPSSRRSDTSVISLDGPHPSPGMTAAGPVKKRKVSDDYDLTIESSPSGTATNATATATATGRRPAKVPKNTNAQAATGGNANTEKKKKAQNKYEPDVPMTKEEAAAWRREQRRKRNRESAAASRQKQRDRIVELETELGEWKAKFSAVMDRLNAAEVARGIVPSAPSDLPISEEIHVESGTGSTDTTNGFTVTDPTSATVHQGSPSMSNETQQQKHHLIETIPRPA